MNMDAKRKLAKEAASWVVSVEAAPQCTETQAACRSWREASPENERAWSCAQQLKSKLANLPTDVAYGSLSRPEQYSRRDVIKLLSVLMMSAPAAYWGSQSDLGQKLGQGLIAETNTAVGRSKALSLEDGSHLTLNTDTAIDIQVTATARIIQLRYGELLIKTGKKDSLRPLLVETALGVIRPIGTEFTVRQDNPNSTQVKVAVVSGQVTISTRASAIETTVDQGFKRSFSAVQVGEAEPIEPIDYSWENGVLKCSNYPLGEFLNELGRYRNGILRCDPAVAMLRISGSFRLDNTDQILAALPHTLPVSVSKRSRYWVTVAPA